VSGVTYCWGIDRWRRDWSQEFGLHLWLGYFGIVHRSLRLPKQCSCTWRV